MLKLLEFIIAAMISIMLTKAQIEVSSEQTIEQGKMSRKIDTGQVTPTAKRKLSEQEVVPTHFCTLTDVCNAKLISDLTPGWKWI
jgi:hypothetical protein